VLYHIFSCEPAQGISLPNSEIDINLLIVNNNVFIDYLKQKPITILVEIGYCFENRSGIYVGVDFRIEKSL